MTVLALITSVFSLVMAGPRVYARMADDGVFPVSSALVAAARPRRPSWRRPRWPFSSSLVSDLRGLLSYLGFTLSVSAALTVASLFLIAKREGRAAVAVWGYPFTPAFYVLATLILAALAGRRSPIELLTMVITLVSGSLVYYAFGLHRAWQLPARSVTTNDCTTKATLMESARPCSAWSALA